MDVQLRPFEEADAPALTALVEASLEHLRPWMPWAADEPRGTAWRRAWIRDRRREAQGGGDETYAIWVDGALAGACGLHRRLGPGALEIGYWVGVGFLRRGVATAAVRQLCRRAFARPSVQRVEIHHEPANAASARVAAAAGFTRTAIPDGAGHVVWVRRRGGGGA